MSSTPANRLANETSPYLLQHAHNPVDWYPWGDEAFEKAHREDKPIFLSVGYSSCHWCHVMERESFENEEIARILNEHFVSIKVDREERPDVDAIYMTSVQILTRSGGWPMSLFLTPDLKPFFGGTYYPPESRLGHPGFKDVLRHVAHVYRQERDKVSEQAERLTEYLGASLEPSLSEPPGAEAFNLMYRHATQSFDSTFGGFGTAPKFPHSVDLSLLLRHWNRTGETTALDIALLTLKKMAEGGMYDQIGGGFHRYSVDRQWLVPHFEKMLYDNALLVRTYLEAYQVTGETFYRRVATEVLDYVVKEMTSPEGGFYSATDADSEGEEGRFFVWKPQQVEALLGPEKARLFCLYYNITVGGNFEQSMSIPHVTRSMEEVAQGLNIDPQELFKIVEEGKAQLYKRREERVKPFRDEKVIVAWNALMLASMARGYQITREERYRKAAEGNARFLQERCLINGVLHRIYKDGQTKIPGFLDDYAYLTEALVDLYEATFHLPYLEQAQELTERLLAEFGDAEGKGLFYTSGSQKDLIQRRKDFIDNATPSGIWLTAIVLLRLERLTGKERYRKEAEQLLAGLQSLVEKAPMAFASALLALDFQTGPVVEIVVIGDPHSAETGSILEAIHRQFIPRKVVAGAAGKADDKGAALVPLLKDRQPIDGRTTVYLCEDFTCKTPLTDLQEVEKALERYVRRLD